MAYEEKPGDLSVFKNDKKTEERHPDYRIIGTGLDGRKVKGALWLKKDRNGKTYMSGKIEEDTYVKPSDGDDSFLARRQGNVAGRDSYDLNDDIPF
jgi:uncharacterized protein (DUF736 family)